MLDKDYTSVAISTSISFKDLSLRFLVVGFRVGLISLVTIRILVSVSIRLGSSHRVPFRFVCSTVRFILQT